MACRIVHTFNVRGFIYICARLYLFRNPFECVYDVRISVYHVGSEYGWSPIFRFTALQERPEGGFIYAVYGDLGNVNARSLGKIQQQAQRRIFDMVLHVGW